MNKQLTLDLFKEISKEEYEGTMPVLSQVFSVKSITDDILLDTQICPSCDSEYIPSQGCDNCGLGKEPKGIYENIIEEDDFKLEDIRKKASYVNIGVIKFPNGSNRKAKNFYIPENRELRVDIENSIIGESKATIFIKIKDKKYKIECFYETINQQDENHRIDTEMPKIIHNLKLKTFDISNGNETGFDFKLEILKQLKTKLTTDILNRPKYNKNL